MLTLLISCLVIVFLFMNAYNILDFIFRGYIVGTILFWFVRGLFFLFSVILILGVLKTISGL